MEHPCYKCQTSIDESLPFCPHCGAPQIRVASSDDDASQPVPLASEATPQVGPPAGWTVAPPVYHPYAIQWELAWKGALLSGLIAAVLTAVPVVGLGCCLWLLGAGALAVALYQRRIPSAIVTPGMGMRIGAVAGAIGFVATTIWSVFRFATSSQEFRSAMQEQMEKSIASNPDPRAQDIMRQFMNTLNTPEGLATFFVIVIVIMAIVFVVLGAAGGAIGASMFARRRNLR
ncbi:MAG TPA: hypothetical protein VMU45_05990 [Candidatus Eisenbacteria bacterium]|nr:hypothetical protein [Candidatus Eisenbacteria bacterium]